MLNQFQTRHVKVESNVTESDKLLSLVKEVSEKFNLNRNQKLILYNLMQVHGPSRLARESSGIHMYLPSPIALEKDGKIELYKKHLSLNLDKLKKTEDKIALCHKYNVSYSVDELLSMSHIEKRCGTVVKRVLNTYDSRAGLIHDEDGNVIHEPAGDVIPINKLPEEHPAVQYILNRTGGAFSPDILYEHFRVSYCANPSSVKKYYKYPNDFDKSPMGRIVFFVDQIGKERGWQARLIEFEDDDHVFIWNGYKNLFYPVYIKSDRLLKEGRTDEVDYNPKTGKPKDLSILNPYRKINGFTLPKYLISAGSSRNEAILGYDAAERLARKNETRNLFITEGPFDATRIFHAGYPAVALMGKYCDITQVRVMTRYFKNFYVVGDTDDAGKVMMDNVHETFLRSNILVNKISVPNDYKDVAEMTVDQVRKMIDSYT